MPVQYHWGDPGRIAESAWHSDRKWLPGSVPKMEETVGPVSTCGRGLLQGWRRPIGLMVSFMIFTASVRKILDQTSYNHIKNTSLPSYFLHRISLQRLWLLSNVLLHTRVFTYFQFWNTGKKSDSKEQHVCTKFCFKLVKHATETFQTFKWLL